MDDAFFISDQTAPSLGEQAQSEVSASTIRKKMVVHAMRSNTIPNIENTTRISISCAVRGAKVVHVLPDGEKFANEDGTPSVRSFPELQ